MTHSRASREALRCRRAHHRVHPTLSSEGTERLHLSSAASFVSRSEVCSKVKELRHDSRLRARAFLCATDGASQWKRVVVSSPRRGVSAIDGSRCRFENDEGGRNLSIGQTATPGDLSDGGQTDVGDEDSWSARWSEE